MVDDAGAGDAQAMTDHATYPTDVRRLERSRDDRMVAGVAGGLGRYFDLHPMFFRVGFVVLTLLGGSGILIYLAAALVMPNQGEQDSIASGRLKRHRDQPAALAGLAIIGVVIICLLSQARFADGGAVWLLLLVGAVLLVWAERGRRSVLVVVASLSALVTVLLVATALLFAYLDVHPSQGVGDRSWAPTTAASLQRDYTLGIGSLRLDLSDLQLPPGQSRRVKARVGIGELKVTVPPDAQVKVDGVTRFGDVTVFGRHDEGRDATVTIDSRNGEPARTLVLDLHVAAGDLQVDRAVR
jgi:phage shock protein PspC (stress-responsive transcriptional regulator)/predicted membrane protein